MQSGMPGSFAYRKASDDVVESGLAGRRDRGLMHLPGASSGRRQAMGAVSRLLIGRCPNVVLRVLPVIAGKTLSTIETKGRGAPFGHRPQRALSMILGQTDRILSTNDPRS